METLESYYDQVNAGQVLPVSEENTVQDHRTIMPVGMVDVATSVLVCITISMVFVLLEPRVLHWCVVPLIMCGTIIGTDAMRWLRGSLDTFDPKGVIGMFGLHFFFIAPLVVVCYGADYSKYGGSPPDWRPWIGYMGWLNVSGLIAYESTQYFAFRRRRLAKKVWVLSVGRGSIILWAIILFSVASWVLVMARMGGIAGIVEEHFYKVGARARLGTFIFFATAITPLVLLALTIQRKDRSRIGLPAVAAVLAVCAVVQFVAIGFFGSRRSIIYPLIWAVGIIHYYWRDLRPKVLLGAMLILLPAGFFYGLYKAGGPRFLDFLRGHITISELTRTTNETIAGTLVGDLSRADLQAWMVYKWKRFRGDYDPRHGRTYIWAPITLRPSWLFPKKSQHSEKTIAGTDYMYGKGYFDPAKFHRASFRVYGLAGEAILNFGLWAIPVAFAVWGFFVGYLRGKWVSWPMGDARFFIMPMLTILAVVALLFDSDNFWNSVIGHLIIPSVAVFLVSSRSHMGSEMQIDVERAIGYEVEVYRP